MQGGVYTREPSCILRCQTSAGSFILAFASEKFLFAGELRPLLAEDWESVAKAVNSGVLIL